MGNLCCSKSFDDNGPVNTTTKYGSGGNSGNGNGRTIGGQQSTADARSAAAMAAERRAQSTKANQTKGKLGKELERKKLQNDIPQREQEPLRVIMQSGCLHANQ